MWVCGEQGDQSWPCLGPPAGPDPHYCLADQAGWMVDGWLSLQEVKLNLCLPVEFHQASSERVRAGVWASLTLSFSSFIFRLIKNGLVAQRGNERTGGASVAFWWHFHAESQAAAPRLPDKAASGLSFVNVGIATPAGVIPQKCFLRFHRNWRWLRPTRDAFHREFGKSVLFRADAASNLAAFSEHGGSPDHASPIVFKLTRSQARQLPGGETQCWEEIWEADNSKKFGTWINK